MAYAKLTTIQSINTSDILTAALLQQADNNGEFLINPPACSVYNPTPASLGTGTTAAFAGSAEFFDNDSMHSTSTNNSRITVQTAGRYQFSATVRFDPDADGIRRGAFRITAGTVYESMQVPGVSTLRSCVITCIAEIVCAQGDYVELLVEHTAGNNIDVQLYQFSAKFLTR